MDAWPTGMPEQGELVSGHNLILLGRVHFSGYRTEIAQPYIESTSISPDTKGCMQGAAQTLVTQSM